MDPTRPSQPPERPNPIHRYVMHFENLGKKYKTDYVAAERRHPLGIMGGRVVVLYL